MVIAYKELRKLEHAILDRLAELSSSHQSLWADSRISIENFYGIEIDDFAVEVAILSLWIAKHQMNSEFREKFRVEIPLIPLKETGQIRAGNATRVDWNEVCPNDGESEIYLIGNPPYGGSTMQSKSQKADFEVALGRAYPKKLDYVAIWFVKGATYIEGTRAELAFVTTNSVAQGEHVGLMFPTILDKNIEIGYAYTSFKWENNAKHNAGVTVAVICLRNVKQGQKFIFTDGIKIEATNINGYLADAPSFYLYRRSTALSSTLPRMTYGSKPSDGGHLILDENERAQLLEAAPASAKFIKRYIGAAEYINGVTRWCLVIPDAEVSEARSIDDLSLRLDKVADYRSKSSEKSTREAAKYPNRFYFFGYKPTDSIIVPRVSSERRPYIPMGYLGPDTVISDAASAVYDAEPWLFALLNSAVHMAWTRAVGGRMKTDYRYSNTVVYNNFPVPPISEAMKGKLTVAALRVLDVREYHCEHTLAELYDPDKMPQDLREAHAAIDALVDSIYSKKSYETDEQRLSDLFAMYERMTAEEAAKAPAKKPRRTAK